VRSIAESDEIARIQLQSVRDSQSLCASKCPPAEVRNFVRARTRVSIAIYIESALPAALRIFCLQYELIEERREKRKQHVAFLACSKHVFQPRSSLAFRVQGLPTKRNNDGRENGNDPEEYSRIRCYKYKYIGYADFPCLVLIATAITSAA
jgi:hypothetical protein